MTKSPRSRIRLHAGILCVVIVAALSMRLFVMNKDSALAQTKADSSNRLVLDNGLVLLLHPVAGSDQVAMEAFYRVGFLDEPKGMTQAAHLLEHLVCQSATKSFRAGETMALLNERGMANAETLPHFTHYDYMLSAKDFELALRIEAERMTTLRITTDGIRQEAPKCYQEADFVERNPQAGMLKHAFMALNQLWHHRVTQAQVRGGLENIPVAQLEEFFRTTYQPNKAVLVLIGAFKREEALRLAKLHMGSVPSGDVKPAKAIDWSQVPKQATVQWDSSARAVCLAFPPPDDVKERVLLSLWGNVLMQKLMTDHSIRALADSVFCTNQMWNVGGPALLCLCDCQGKCQRCAASGNPFATCASDGRRRTERSRSNSSAVHGSRVCPTA